MALKEGSQEGLVPTHSNVYFSTIRNLQHPDLPLSTFTAFVFKARYYKKCNNCWIWRKNAQQHMFLKCILLLLLEKLNITPLERMWLYLPVK